MTDEEKALDIQPGDEVGYYGVGTHKLYSTAVDTHEVNGVKKLIVLSRKFSGTKISVDYRKIFERHRTIPGTGTSSRYYEMEESERGY